MKQWFVVQTKSKQELLAEVNLERQGYQTYCPRVIQKRRYRGSWRKIIEPLFPRYLFVQLEQGRDDFAPIRCTLGVSSLVRFGGIPRAVCSNFIEEMKSLEDDNQNLPVSRPPWRPGDEVEILEGVLSGFRGLFLAESGAERVVLLLNMLGREHKVIVKQDTIVPA